MAGDSGEQAHALLSDLAAIEGKLRSFAEEVWGGIDFRDRAAREQRIRQLDEFATLVDRYQAIATDLADGIHMLAVAGQGVPPNVPPNVTPIEAARITRLIEQPQGGHTLVENFTHTHPIAYRLRGRLTRLDPREWRALYLSVWQELLQLNPSRVRALARQNFPTGVKPFISRDTNEFIVARNIADGLFVEVNLSANGACERIHRLLTEFDISPEDMRVYLSSDEDPQSTVPAVRRQQNMGIGP